VPFLLSFGRKVLGVPDDQALPAVIHKNDRRIRESLERRKMWLSGRVRARDVLYGRLPYGRSFPSTVLILIKRLEEEMRVPPDALDGSIESLSRVDDFIKARGASDVLSVELGPDRAGAFRLFAAQARPRQSLS